MLQRPFRDRVDAGRKLGLRLGHLARQSPVVLGLPRGGVVVAAEVASALQAPLDVLVVRKIPAPNQPELALGAVTHDGHQRVFLNESIVAALGVGSAYLDDAIADQLAAVRQRQAEYRNDQSIQISGRTVIVVDDGIATGATMQVGLAALRQADPSYLALAVPVAPPDSIEMLRSLVDEVVCLSAPAHFTAVGEAYGCFEQTSDQEVMALLRQATGGGE
jgi:predicted phosphoribosyltransferase